MDTKELLKKIQKIEVKARGASKQLFSGGHKSPFRGLGMEFAEVRQYFPGDETRAIDWNVTARLNEPFVKTFDEEKELAVMLLVDVSYSTFLGSSFQSKKEYVAELAAVIAFSAIGNNDKVGLMLFSDEVEKYIAPKKGKQHVLRIIRELLAFEPVSKKTNIGGAMNYFTNAWKKRSTVFVISDFEDDAYDKALKTTAKRHDVMAIRVQDQMDRELPSVGTVTIRDMESGKLIRLDTSDKKVQKAHKEWVEEQDELYSSLLKRSGVDSIELLTSEAYVKPLKKAFSKR